MARMFSWSFSAPTGLTSNSDACCAGASLDENGSLSLVEAILSVKTDDPRAVALATAMQSGDVETLQRS